MKARIKKNISTILRRIMERLGFEVFPAAPDHHYVPKLYGRSASKQADIRSTPVFGELANKVIKDKYTYLYYDRLFTIYHSLLHVKTLAMDKDAINTAELGVYRGGGSYFIASAAEKLDLPIKHYCFDTFEGHTVEDVNDALEPRQKPGSFDNTDYDEVKKYLQKFPNISIHKGRFQDSCHNLDGMKFGFVHLDMDIYTPTIFALDYFEDKMIKGGVILLDDYGFLSCPGIEKAATEFVSKAGNKYFGMPLLTGQYILIRH
jgi:hypothetical protein